MKKVLVVGAGGREASICTVLQKDCQVYAVISHPNPTIVDIVQSTNGQYIVSNTKDGEQIAQYALENKIDYAIVNNDESLAAGVVDALRNVSIPTFGPTQDGAKIEWSKSFSRSVVDAVDPSANPQHLIIHSLDDLAKIAPFFGRKEIVVKPDGLTGGKGVKVMGAHLQDLDEAVDYAKELLTHQSDLPVVIEEKIQGFEFTIMGITDGNEIVFAPPTYDYPYRFDGDTGPGTGGMGCFTHENQRLPFLNEEDLVRCHEIMRNVLKKLNADGDIFNGVLNGGFFKVDGEIKLMEFNSRLGDPECLNTVYLLDTPFIEVVDSVVQQKLTAENCRFQDGATVVVYLVSKGYALQGDSSPVRFSLDTPSLEQNGIYVNFSSCKRDQDHFVSVGTSRLVGLVAYAPTLEEAKQKIYQNIDQFAPKTLDYRSDIGDLGPLQK